MFPPKSLVLRLGLGYGNSGLAVDYIMPHIGRQMLRVRHINPVSEKLARHREWFVPLYIWDAHYQYI